ncbi:DUF4129 domain-containing protein [Luethyella okanaganae]|uniref:DUF4129 domain-containing protein n=2 Tax=Luethyella okanaganae TaxID=69372 RepID=A0ABW1VD57_9MICO
MPSAPVAHPPAVLGMATIDVPVDPEAPEARQWLIDELAKPPYQAAKPSLFDHASKAVWDWLNSLFVPTGDAFDGWLPILVVGVVVVLIAVAFLVFGLPRLNRRSRTAIPLFGIDERRSAGDIRQAARAAAASGDWSLAIEEQFRAIASDLSSRTILNVTPGTTANEFARAAAYSFPAEREGLRTAAAAFDEVRYLDRAGTEDGFRHVLALDERLRTTRPGNLGPSHVGTPGDRA